MKCWKCGKELQDKVTTCVYCNASQQRPVPKTRTGAAMRQIYDKVGRDAALTKKTLMVNALHDLLEDSRKIRMELDMVYEVGIAGLYLTQLQGSGTPDADFRRRVKIQITQDAGFSDTIADEIMLYFDEMIGWNRTGQSQGEKKSSSSSKTEQTHVKYESKKSEEEINRDSREEFLKWKKEKERKEAEAKKKEENQKQTSSPKSPETRTIHVSTPEQKPSIYSSLPTCKVDGGAFGFYMVLAVIFLLAAVFVPNGVTPVLMIISVVLALICKPKGAKSVHILDYKNGQYSVRWDMSLQGRWAVAVDGKWIASGTEKVDEVKFTAKSLPVTISICTIGKDDKQSTLQGKVTLTQKGVME